MQGASFERPRRLLEHVRDGMFLFQMELHRRIVLASCIQPQDSVAGQCETFVILMEIRQRAAQLTIPRLLERVEVGSESLLGARDLVIVGAVLGYQRQRSIVLL